MEEVLLDRFVGILEFVSNHVDQGFPIDVIYSSCQKAFKEVPRVGLMLKLKALLAQCLHGLRIG
jgi:hypothetical protein